VPAARAAEALFPTCAVDSGHPLRTNFGNKEAPANFAAPFSGMVFPIPNAPTSAQQLQIDRASA
jgi:hypothetical protein